MGMGDNKEKSIIINKYGEIAEAEQSTESRRGQLIAELVKTKFDRYPTCTKWHGQTTYCHAEDGDHNWECGIGRDRDRDWMDDKYQTTIVEDILQSGFDLAIDDMSSKMKMYMQKWGEYYVGMLGTTDIVGTGSHNDELEEIVRNSPTTPSSWDRFRLKETMNKDRWEVSLVRR